MTPKRDVPLHKRAERELRMRRFDPQKYTLARRRWWRSVEVGARLRVTHPGIYYGRIGAVITKSWDGAYVEVEAKRYRYFRMEDLEPT